MKLLIEKELIHYDHLVLNDTKLNGKELYDEITQLYSTIITMLNQFCIHHKFEITGNEAKLTILPQKVCLDEYQMNNLFYDILCFFDYKVEVTPLGNDVDFCLEIK